MPRRILEGNVVSNKADKTITVLVERRYMHPMYKKYVKRTDKYAAHDEANKYQVGDRVQIIECRPISKRKCWTVLEGGVSANAPKLRVKKEDASKKAEAKKAAPKKEEAKAEKPAKAEAKETKAKKAPAKKPAAKKTTEKKKKD